MGTVVPAAKIKTRIDHIVSLADQVVCLFEEIKPLIGHRQYVFPGARSPRRHMSENALLAALRNLGYTKEQMTPHGFRATARTLLDEELGFAPHLIEHQLSHAVKDANTKALILFEGRAKKALSIIQSKCYRAIIYMD